jgi:hypothetical protein
MSDSHSRRTIFLALGDVDFKSILWALAHLGKDRTITLEVKPEFQETEKESIQKKCCLKFDRFRINYNRIPRRGIQNAPITLIFFTSDSK